MAEPTAYDLTQDSRIDDLEDVVTVSDNPIEGPEYSFPIPNYPVNQEQFQLLSLVNGNGVIDRGGRPYWLTGHGSDSETNAQNSMILKVSTTIGRAESVVAGYYHVLTQDKTIPLGPVASTTTYRICLTYDPRDDEERLGPVSIQVYDTQPPTTLGRVSVILWEVTRRPNQLLTDAAITRIRPRVAPPIYVWAEDHKPDPDEQLSGSLCVVGQTRAIYRVSSDEDESGSRGWVSLTDPPWTNLPDNATYGWTGHGHRRGYRRTGENSVQLRGRIKIVDGDRDFKQGGGSNSAGYGILSLPSDLTPQREQRFIVASGGWSGNRLNVVTVSEDGTVYGMPLLGDIGWLSLDGIEYSLHD